MIRLCNEEDRLSFSLCVLLFFKIRATALSPVPPVITDERFNLLCPSPKHMHQLSDEVNFLPERMTISISPGIHSIHE